MLRKPLALLTLAATAALAPIAKADTLDFSGDICSGTLDGSGAFAACANWGYINQAYGDTATVNVSYLDPSAFAAPGQSALWWADSYSGLQGVAFGGGSHVRITLTPTAGHQVTLNGFDMGAWPNAELNTSLSVYAVGGSPSFVGYTIGSPGGTTPNHFSPGLTSATGIVIEFKDQAYNVGIDNINFSVTAVPEPSGVALALAALGVVGLGRRQQQRRLAAAR